MTRALYCGALATLLSVAAAASEHTGGAAPLAHTASMALARAGPCKLLVVVPDGTKQVSLCRCAALARAAESRASCAVLSQVVVVPRELAGITDLRALVAATVSGVPPVDGAAPRFA